MNEKLSQFLMGIIHEFREAFIFYRSRVITK